MILALCLFPADGLTAEMMSCFCQQESYRLYCQSFVSVQMSAHPCLSVCSHCQHPSALNLHLERQHGVSTSLCRRQLAFSSGYCQHPLTWWRSSALSAWRKCQLSGTHIWSWKGASAEGQHRTARKCQPTTFYFCQHRERGRNSRSEKCQQSVGYIYPSSARRQLLCVPSL